MIQKRRFVSARIKLIAEIINKLWDTKAIDPDEPESRSLT